eukprot:363706_1
MSNKQNKGDFDNKQLLEQLQKMKSKFNKQTKTVKQLRKHRNAETKKVKTIVSKELEEERKKIISLQHKLDKCEKKNKVLKSQMQHLKCKKEKQTADPRVGALRKENRDLRMKLLKDTLVTINKRKQWYNRSIKVFKNNQQKWIDKQQKTFKDKKLIIKYVFMDDIKYIKQYKKSPKNSQKNGQQINNNSLQFKNKVQFQMKNGGETTKNNVEIIVLDEDKSQAKHDEEIDKFMNELMEEFEVTNHGIECDDDDIKWDNAAAKTDLNVEYKDNVLYLQKRLGQLETEIKVKNKVIKGSLNDEYKDKILFLQKRLDKLELEIKQKDKFIENLKCDYMYVNKINNRKDIFMDGENESHEKKHIELMNKKEYGKLNIKIESNSNIMKREVHIESAVKNSQFLLKDSMEKLKKENEALRLQIERIQKKK